MYTDNRREESYLGILREITGLWDREEETLKLCKFVAVFRGDFPYSF